MEKWIETTGRTEEDAISAALFQLGLERDDVSVEVVERAKAGFLGFGSNPAKVRVRYEDDNGTPRPLRDPLEEELFSTGNGQLGQENKKEAEPPKPEQEPVVEAAAPVEEETILTAKPGWQPHRQKGETHSVQRSDRPVKKPKASRTELQEGDEVIIGASSAPKAEQAPLKPASGEDEKAAKIVQFLTGLMERLEVQAVPEVYVGEEGSYKVILQGKDLGSVIGRRGETLDAIQQLTSYAVNHGQSKRVRVHVDAEGYRAKREESLCRLAVKVAGKVVRYRKNMTLEPMNAYERHVIHTALQDYPNVTTYSTGVEPNRRTVVAYAPGQK